MEMCYGGVYTIGQVAGERVYYSGYANSTYQNDKWAIRAGVVSMFGILAGTKLMFGFENKF